MSKSEMIQHLYDEINRQNTWYMWTVGILITLLIAFTGLLGFFQWKLSSKQVESIKSKIKLELNDEYNLDKIGKVSYLEMQNDAVLNYLCEDLKKQIRKSFTKQDIYRYATILSRLIIAIGIRKIERESELTSMLDAVSAYTEASNKIINDSPVISQYEWGSYDGSIEIIIKMLTEAIDKKTDKQEEKIEKKIELLKKLKDNIASHILNE